VQDLHFVATYCYVSISVRKNFVVCPQEPLIKLGVPWVKKGCGTLLLYFWLLWQNFMNLKEVQGTSVIKYCRV
jgi:hypothetical protein